jgi:hypothetical protein
MEAEMGKTSTLRDLATLENASKVAVLGWTATAHVELATQLGAAGYLRWSLPLALDAYFLASLRARRDRPWAIGLVMVAVAGSHAAHQFDLQGPGHVGARAAIAAGLGVLLILTMWRVVMLSQWRTDTASVAADRERQWRDRWRALRLRVLDDRQAVAKLGDRLATYEATIEQLRGDLLAAAGQPPAGPRGRRRRRPDLESELPQDAPGIVRWIAGSLDDGQAWTWRQVQELWPALSDRDAQRRLTAARKAQKRHGLTAVAGEA